MFHGWALAKGVRPVELPPPDFLDLVHHYLLLSVDEKEHARLNRTLIGAGEAAPEIDERAGFAPPSWWRGDDYATKSGIAAKLTLRR